MQYITHRNNTSDKNLQEIANRVINCIHAKIEMTTSISNRKSTDYTYYVVNTHGSPILSTEYKNKIKNIVLNKLINEGFSVQYKLNMTPGSEWSIIISW